MPIDPVTGYLITQLGGALLSGLFGGGSDQERNSFAGTAVDPIRMLSNANTFAGNYGKILADRAAQPITLRGSTVQQPGAYTGGGLPMPIGLVATDPALSDPSILTLAGNPLFAHLFDGMNMSGGFGTPSLDVGGSTPLGTGGSSLTGGETVTPWADQVRDPDGPLGPDAPMGDAFGDFYLPNFNANSPQNPNGTSNGAEPERGNPAEARMSPRRRSDGGGEYGQLVRANDLQGGDDLTRGIGAVNLLLEAYGLPTRME